MESYLVVLTRKAIVCWRVERKSVAAAQTSVPWSVQRRQQAANRSEQPRQHTECQTAIGDATRFVQRPGPPLFRSQDGLEQTPEPDCRAHAKCPVAWHSYAAFVGASCSPCPAASPTLRGAPRSHPNHHWLHKVASGSSSSRERIYGHTSHCTARGGSV
jgi:hypothetical protein